MDGRDFIMACKEDVMAGRGVTPAGIKGLMDVPDGCVGQLAVSADEITRRFNGPRVDVEQLNNIKKNACSEDCTFCGQSAFFDTGIDTYRLPPADEIVDAAAAAKRQGAGSYCLVAAWREPPPGEFERVCEIISRINAGVGIAVECSLGFLTGEQAGRLAALGVKRYNHNLETARSRFPDICTTHTYQDRLDTLRTARRAGLELCTGGIIGIGETRAQRAELVQELAALRPEEVTINILVPVAGTPLALQAPLPGHEITRMFAVTRFALPGSIIKISGGREAGTADAGERLLRGGANGIITGGYLTTGGNGARTDLEMIRRIGLKA